MSVMQGTDRYSQLGVRPVINACATLTRLGGSIMPPEVIAAMQDASRCFVDLDELQRRVGERIAELTRNEAAYVATGAAAGLVLATAACTAGPDPDLRNCFPKVGGGKNQVVMQSLHRNAYDYAVRQTGVTVVEVGDEDGASTKDLERAINEHTAAVFWYHGAMNRPTEVPFADVVSIAGAASVPVIVDAAAQLPPVENLWRFTQEGASLVLFSGGKDLRGPQCSGLVLGRRELIEAIRVHGSPNHAIGRPMKVGKEEMMGCLAAVERYVHLNHEARSAAFEETVAFWNEGLAALPGIETRRDFPNEAGQPVPWTLVTFADAARRDAVVKALRDGEPAIAVAPAGERAIHLNPMTLYAEGEQQIVLERFVQVVTELGEA